MLVSTDAVFLGDQLMSTVFKVPEMQMPFDRRSLPAYATIILMAASGLGLCVWLGFSISPVIFPNFFQMPLMAVLAGWGLRRIGRPNLGSAMEMLGLFYIQGLAAFFLIAPLASISGPLADPSLAQADQFLGFDWMAYAHLTEPLNLPLLVAYKSFAWQPAFVALAVFLLGQSNRGWRLVTAAVLALLITSLVFPLLPARGSVIFYGANVPFAPRASTSASALLALKSGSRLLDNSVFTALIAFPSYHAAAAALYVWGCWKTPFRWPVLALNVVMLAGAITIGGHYLIDIIGGLVVAAIALGVAGLLVRPLEVH